MWLVVELNEWLKNRQVPLNLNINSLGKRNTTIIRENYQNMGLQKHSGILSQVHYGMQTQVITLLLLLSLKVDVPKFHILLEDTRC